MKRNNKNSSPQKPMPSNLEFKVNIQEFYQKIIYISHLENKGQITPEEADQQIKFFWKPLKTSNKLHKIYKNKSNG